MRRTLASLLLITAAAAGCNAPTGDSAEYDQPFTSDVATLLVFDFDGQLTAASASNPSGLRARAAALHRRPAQRRERRRAAAEAQAHQRHDDVDRRRAVSRALSRAAAGRVGQQDQPADGVQLHAAAARRRADDVHDASTAPPATTASRTTSPSTTSGTTTARTRRAARSPRPTSSTAAATVAVVEREHASRSIPSTTRSGKTAALQIVAIFGKYDDSGNDHADAGIAAFNEFVGRGARRVPDGDDVPGEPARPTRASTIAPTT